MNSAVATTSAHVRDTHHGHLWPFHTMAWTSGAGFFGCGFESRALRFANICRRILCCPLALRLRLSLAHRDSAGYCATLASTRATLDRSDPRRPPFSWRLGRGHPPVRPGLAQEIQRLQLALRISVVRVVAVAIDHATIRMAQPSHQRPSRHAALGALQTAEEEVAPKTMRRSFRESAAANKFRKAGSQWIEHLARQAATQCICF